MAVSVPLCRPSLHEEADGEAVGASVGAAVGMGVGAGDGTGVGTCVGVGVGIFVGADVGDAVGSSVGAAVGEEVGLGVGDAVGSSANATNHAFAATASGPPVCSVFTAAKKVEASPCTSPSWRGGYTTWAHHRRDRAPRRIRIIVLTDIVQFHSYMAAAVPMPPHAAADTTARSAAVSSMAASSRTENLRWASLSLMRRAASSSSGCT